MVEHGALRWEEIACPLCETEAYEKVLCVPSDCDRPFQVVRCSRCSLVYLNPRPTEECIGRFYPEDYEPYQPPAGHGRGHGRQSAWRQWRERLLGPDRDSMANLPLEGGGRLLDYGCGSGWYASRMQERGWQVTGMDMSPHAVDKARQHFGLEVIHGTLPHDAVAPQSFDVITMGAVLEHLHWPRRVIGAAAEALKPGGRLVISVPNFASWGFRTFKTNWWPLELPRHLLHFTPVTLQYLVELHGLEVIELRMLGRTGWMRRSLTALRAPTAPPSLLHSSLASLGRLRMIQSWLTRWTVWTGQADCLLLIARRPCRGANSLLQAA